MVVCGRGIVAAWHDATRHGTAQHGSNAFITPLHHTTDHTPTQHKSQALGAPPPHQPSTVPDQTPQPNPIWQESPPIVGSGEYCGPGSGALAEYTLDNANGQFRVTISHHQTRTCHHKMRLCRRHHRHNHHHHHHRQQTTPPTPTSTPPPPHTPRYRQCGQNHSTRGLTGLDWHTSSISASP